MKKLMMLTLPLVVLAAFAGLSAAQTPSVLPPPVRSNTIPTAPAPLPLCVVTNGAPQYVTATGKAPNENNAKSMAQNNWSSQASRFGGAYTDWNKAAQKRTNCTSQQVFTYTCTYIAQPCR